MLWHLTLTVTFNFGILAQYML